MYENYFGLTKTPFSKDIAASQLFGHAGHDEALARLGYLVKERAIGVLTGEVGSGKTVALRALTSNLDASRHTVVYFCGLAGIRGFYMEFVSSLGAIPNFLRAHMVRQAKELIAQETTEKRKNLIVIIDEAHLVPIELLEELRLLTNEAMDSKSQFSLILSGQPTLRRKLQLTQLNALSQRISLRYQLKGLARDETAKYIHHHLTLAGRADALFSDDAVSLIHSSSAGIPRKINNLCAQALIAGFIEKKAIIDESTVNRAVAETVGD